MRRRVVITGAGCVTPVGVETGEVWDNLTAGRSGAAEITIFDASTFPVRIAAEVKNWSISDEGEMPEQWQDHARQTRFVFGAALRAARSARLDESDLDPLRTGVYLGCGEIFPDFHVFAEAMRPAVQGGQFAQSCFQEAYAKLANRDAELIMEPGVAVSSIAGRFNLEGPGLNFTNACVSSATAIGEALEVIRRNDADLMLVGGAHSMIHPMGITGFHRLSTLSTRNDHPTAASRPFERDRDGFVTGEGAAILVIEELEHARRRGAEIWAELRGYGASHDAYRISDPHPQARGAARAMETALQDAGLATDEIDYVNAHGSGTVVNDAVETEAVKRVFGPAAHRIPVSSTKSMTGHLTTACGALETLVCALSVRSGVIPPTINYDHPDPACDLDYVPNTAREIQCDHALNNNLGFGGPNVSLVISRFAG